MGTVELIARNGTTSFPTSTHSSYTVQELPVYVCDYSGKSKEDWKRLEIGVSCLL